MIVNNLESYFEDCGCSGAARGGVARLPSAGFGNIVSCIFTGNTLFEARQLTNPLANESRQLAMQANSATLLLRALPDPHLLSPSGEIKALVDLTKQGVNVEFLRSIVSSTDTVLAGGVPIIVNETAVSVDAGLTWTRFPEHGSRARRVIICAVWDGGGRFPVQYTPALDGLAPLCEQSALAARRVQEIVDELYSHGVGACSVFVQSIDQSVDERADLSSIMDASRVGAAHALLGPGDN